MNTLRQVISLGRRSLLRTVRQPAAVVPAVLFPLLFLALLDGVIGPAENIPGFPASDYLDFLIGGLLVQGVLFGGLNAGTELAVDLEDGFLDRLSMTPVRRTAMLLGHSAGAVAVRIVQTALMLTIGAALGVEFRSGAWGIAVIFLLIAFISLVFSSLGNLLALRLGSSEAVQGSFPLFFIVLAFSSFFLPRNLLGAGWFKTIADYNPTSYLMEGLRSLVITGWDTRVLLIGFGMAAGLAALGFAGSVRALRSRLAKS
jgi:ABC-2 type transport system permease protein